MKTAILCLTFLSFFFFNELYGQQNSPSNFDARYSSIEGELNDWDPVRGRWLAAAMKSMSVNDPIPDRNFPEDFSPTEMISKVPDTKIENLKSISRTQQTQTRDLLEIERWQKIDSYLNRPRCKPVMGRSYGDPHLHSFDGEQYSFQTAGEFVLAKSSSGHFEVQSRQQPRQDDFSLNTAVAMNLNGDRVGIYATNSPDGRNETGVRVNGRTISIDNNTYYLPHGGTIRRSVRNYLVTAPTGERVSIDVRGTNSGSFINAAVEVYPCSEYRYEGLLGNANGNRNDDYNTRGSNGDWATTFGGQGSTDRFEKERLAFLAKDFANHWRITPMTTLFEYGPGESTATYTDFSFPRIHRTINDLPTNERDQARRICEQQGFRGRDLDECIFDQGFLRIPPTPRPVITDPSRDVVLGRVDKPEPNVNPRPGGNPRDPRPAPVTGGEVREKPKTIVRPISEREEDFSKPAGDNPLPIWKGDRDVKSRPEVREKPESENPVKESPRNVPEAVKDRPATKEKPIARPSPTPVSSPKPVYKPTPSPTPRPTPKPREIKRPPVPIPPQPKPSTPAKSSGATGRSGNE